jgi:serine/threonine-protein kinase
MYKTLEFSHFGRYKVDCELARGGWSLVYKGFDPVIGRPVAIKRPSVENLKLQDVASVTARFQLEAQIAGILLHPHITTVFDYGVEHGIPYQVMELLEGQTLEQVIQEEGGPDINVALSVVDQLCDALAYAHSKGVVHHDLKPRNTMILNTQFVKLMDFGLASTPALRLTQPSQLLGTPLYLAPECLSGAKADCRADIFSLGIILFELLAGQRPFQAGDVATLFYRVVNEAPVPPSVINAAVPAELGCVALKALAKNPTDRYQSCREMAEALQCFKNAPRPMEPATPNAASDTLVWSGPPLPSGEGSRWQARSNPTSVAAGLNGLVTESLSAWI